MSHRAFPIGQLPWLCLAGLLFADTFLFAAPPARRVELIDLDGRSHSPLKNSDAKATVLFFLLPDCPISNAYAPEINRISTHYALSNVASYVVYVSPDFSAVEAKKHATDYGFNIPVLRDLSFELVEQTGVTIAPEVAVVSPEGKCLYRGRIDNLYAALGKRRHKATQHDLRDALDAILKGIPVPKETTKSIGCYLPKPKSGTASLSQ